MAVPVQTFQAGSPIFPGDRVICQDWFGLVNTNPLPILLPKFRKGNYHEPETQHTESDPEVFRSRSMDHETPPRHDGNLHRHEGIVPPWE